MFKKIAGIITMLISINSFGVSLDSLYLITQKGTDQQKALAYFQLSQEIYQKEPSKAIKYANKGLVLAYQNNQIELQAKLHYQVGLSYIQLPDYSKAEEDINKGIAIAEDLNNLGLCGDLYYHFAKIKYKIQEKNLALEYTQKAIKSYQSTNQLDELANSYNLLALVYISSHQNSKGLEYLFKAIEIAQKSGNQKSIANIYVNIGNSLKKQDKLEKALEHHQKALNIAQEINYTDALVVALNNIGDIYLNQKKFRLARAFFKRSINMDKTPFKLKSRSAYSNIGHLHFELGEPFIAKEYYQKSIEIAQRNLNESGKAIGYFNLGKMNFYLNNYNNSIDYLDKVIHIALQLQDIYLQQDAYQYLAKNYDNLKDYKKAFNCFETFHTLKDSIDQLKQQTKLNELQVRYDIKQKEKTIDALKKKRTIDKLKMLNDENKQTIYKFIALGVFFIVLFLILGAYLLYNRYRESKKINKSLTDKNHIIESQRNKILDSINYAQRIQNSILIPEDDIKHIIPKSFVFYKPRDIVSGDLYWIKRLDQKIVVACIDCTGHGVPGAFLTLIANMLLKSIVEERKTSNPSKILEQLDEGIINTLGQEDHKNGSRDGLDISICVIDERNQTIEYAGAMNPIYIVQSHQLTALKANIVSIGGKAIRPGIKEKKKFNTHTLSYNNDTSIYLLTDGYLDQFGGPKNAKFNSNRFKELILKIYQKDMKEQKSIIEETLYDWKKDQKQIDDILVIGLRL